MILTAKGQLIKSVGEMEIEFIITLVVKGNENSLLIEADPDNPNADDEVNLWIIMILSVGETSF